jgi:alkylation response protein AidB-like acyl-CoA dehydrogenase
MTKPSGKLIADQALAVPLRLLTRFGGSELAERLNLAGPAQSLVYRAAKDGLRGATTAAKLFQKRAAAGDPVRGERPSPPALFDLTPTDEQQMIRDTMHRFADEVLRGAAEAADEAAAPPPAFLEQSHELGVTLMAIPEALGGAGDQRSPVTSALIAEELARGDMGLALAALAPLGVVQALVDWGSAAQQATYLPPFTGERFVPAALALLEPQPLFDPYQVRAGAVRTEEGYALHGAKSLVPLAETAELFLVAAQLLGVGPRLFLLERGTPGLTITPEPAMGLRAAGLGRLQLDGAVVPHDALLGEPGREGFDFAAVVDRARLAWCAMAVGTGQAVLDYVKDYCNDRIAFGEPISNRQSVAFAIADIAIELEGMRLLTYRAAALAEQGRRFHREAFLAHTQCANKAMQIGTDGVQLLGGHGFVKDHPVERWYRHLRGAGIMEGALQL